MEKSIFEKEPTKAKNKTGEKTRIVDPDIAQEYYNNALKITTNKGGNPDQPKEMGENLTEKDYENFDDVLEIIRENKFVEKLNIQWDDLSREELMEMYLEAEKILADFDESVVEKLKPMANILNFSTLVMVMLLILMADIPEKLEKLDKFTNANGEVVSISKIIQSSFHF